MSAQRRKPRPLEGRPSMQHAYALRQRLEQTTPREQEEQEYLSEVIEIEMDPEDWRRPKKS